MAGKKRSAIKTFCADVSRGPNEADIHMSSQVRKYRHQHGMRTTSLPSSGRRLSKKEREVALIRAGVEENPGPAPNRKGGKRPQHKAGFEPLLCNFHGAVPSANFVHFINVSKSIKDAAILATNFVETPICHSSGKDVYPVDVCVKANNSKIHYWCCPDCHLVLPVQNEDETWSSQVPGNKYRKPVGVAHVPTHQFVVPNQPAPEPVVVNDNPVIEVSQSTIDQVVNDHVVEDSAELLAAIPVPDPVPEPQQQPQSPPVPDPQKGGKPSSSNIAAAPAPPNVKLPVLEGHIAVGAELRALAWYATGCLCYTTTRTQVIETKEENRLAQQRNVERIKADVRFVEVKFRRLLPSSRSILLIMLFSVLGVLTVNNIPPRFNEWVASRPVPPQYPTNPYIEGCLKIGHFLLSTLRVSLSALLPQPEIRRELLKCIIPSFIVDRWYYNEDYAEYQRHYKVWLWEGLSFVPSIDPWLIGYACIGTLLIYEIYLLMNPLTMLYVPHIVSNLIYDFDRQTNADMVRTNIRPHFRRCAAVGVPDFASVECVSGCEIVTENYMARSNFFGEGLSIFSGSH